MRAVQLGAAISARVLTQPAESDWRWADVAILVKKHAATFAPEAHRYGVPIVWDALDFWKQPADNSSTQERAMALLQAQLTVIKPQLVIGATRAQAEACGGAYLPHHSWAGLVPTPARERVQTVAYEGGAVYLGQWGEWIGAECRARGWHFVVNPPDLSQADIIVAFRDGQWDGWICRQWKSGVKLVNAIAAGRPVIGQHSAARREIQPDGTVVESRGQLAPAFDAWVDQAARQKVVERALTLTPAYTLEAVAKQYQAILESRRSAWAA